MKKRVELMVELGFEGAVDAMVQIRDKEMEKARAKKKWKPLSKDDVEKKIKSIFGEMP